MTCELVWGKSSATRAEKAWLKFRDEIRAISEVVAKAVER